LYSFAEALDGGEDSNLIAERSIDAAGARLITPVSR
jgi:hypothetical protein